MEKLEDMKQQSYCNQYEEEHDILVTADEQSIIHSQYAALQMHPKERERRFRQELDKVTAAGYGLEPLDDNDEEMMTKTKEKGKKRNAKIYDALKEVTDEQVESALKKRIINKDKNN